MDALSSSLSNTPIGCSIGGVMVNHIMYADDLVIISPSAKGLQRLLDICADYSQSHDILFNDSKTVCMYMPANSSFYINTPAVFLNGRRLSFTVKYKYLGTLMTHDGSDEANLSRQRGFFYARSNGLSKNFNACSPSVKATLFRTFCSNMYCGHLWHDFRKSALRKLIVGYNHSFRFLMKFHRNCSASGMFVFNCVPSFMEMWRKYIYDFTQRLTNSDNAIVAATVSSCRISSNFLKRWDCVLCTVHGVWILVVTYIQILWVQYHCVVATIVVYLHVYMGLQPCCLAWNKRFTYLLTYIGVSSSFWHQENQFMNTSCLTSVINLHHPLIKKTR